MYLYSIRKTTDHVQLLTAVVTLHVADHYPKEENKDRQACIYVGCIQNSELYYIAYRLLRCLIVSELLCATASTDTVSEGVDTMDSSIVSSTSDAATQVLTIKMRSVHVSVRMKGRDKGKSVCILVKHIMCMDC